MDYIYQPLLISEFFFAIITFVILLKIKAPYGRHINTNFGPLIPSKLGWIIMESPSVIIMFYFYLNSSVNLVATIFIAIWQIHYLQRTFIFPLFMKGSNKKIPILIVIFSILFNSINAFINGYFIFIISSYENSWIYNWYFIFGLVLFIVGYIINVHSDHVLRSLRVNGDKAYYIPKKGMHKLVAAPNYLGEIIEWCGWALLTLSLPGLAFAIFTIANLVPRALSNLNWYNQEFSDYPKNRKALIPYIL